MNMEAHLVIPSSYSLGLTSRDYLSLRMALSDR
jgi:hypothetical protein